MEKKGLILMLLSAALALAACKDGGEAAEDAGADAARDTGASADADADAGGDAGEDAGPLIDPDRIWADIAVLASEEYGGRAPASPGGELTIDFVRTRFEDLGLENAGSLADLEQSFNVTQWSQTGPSELTVGDETLLEVGDYIAFQQSGSGTVTAEIAFVGYGMTVPAFSQAEYPDCPLDPAGFDDYADIDVTGKIVLVLRRAPNDDTMVYDGCPVNEASTAVGDVLRRFDYKAANAALHDAAAMILVQNYLNPPEYMDMAGLQVFDDPDFPAVFATRTKIESHLPDLQTWVDQIDSTVAPNSRLTGIEATVSVEAETTTEPTANVVGVIEGTDPVLKDEIIVLGGHMDHLGTNALDEIFYGADDNASGTAVMMELARALRNSGIEPKRTILFAGFNGEELGLIGSCYMALTEPPYPMTQVKAMVSLDMVGTGDGSGILVFSGTDEDKAWIPDLMAASAEDMGMSYLVEPQGPMDASDHVCFNMAAVPSVMIQSSPALSHAYYHTSADTIDTISKEALQAAAEVMWAWLLPMALGTEEDYLSSASRPMITPLTDTTLYRSRMERWK